MSSSLEFFIQPQFCKTLTTPGVVVFQSTMYPLLFFTLLRSIWSKKYAITISAVDFEDESNTMQAAFATSFLGNTTSYWLGNLNSLESRAHAQWCNYLQQYTGPHTLIAFCEEDYKFVAHKALTIQTISNTIASHEYNTLTQLLEISNNSTFANHIFSKYPTISLDQACLLSHYQQVTGKSSPQFFKEWLELIVPEKRSLFTLSQAFFSKQPKAFFQLLLKVQDDYPIEFWIAYWSEQLWQSILFISYAQAGNSIEGKKLVNRLPFSFTQKDWRLSTIPELTKAHTFLLNLDYLIKNGGSEYGLDIFYAKFLSNQFAV